MVLKAFLGSVWEDLASPYSLGLNPLGGCPAGVRKKDHMRNSTMAGQLVTAGNIHRFLWIEWGLGEEPILIKANIDSVTSKVNE